MFILCLGKKETLPKHIVHKQYPLLVRNCESDKQKKKKKISVWAAISPCIKEDQYNNL